MAMKVRWFWLLTVIMLTGCIGGTGAPVMVKNYVLEYPPPRLDHRPSADATIRMERFTAAADYVSRDMVYRPRPYVRDAYRHHRWLIPPADMITGLVLRDLRQSGLFGTVFSPEEAGTARYIVEGSIEAFLEINEGERSVASLAVRVTVTDISVQEPRRKVLFQKLYRVSEPVAHQQPSELPRGMSLATASFSRQLLADLASAMGGQPPSR